MGEQSQQEIDYVMKNMFRLDSDGSGLVSFVELVHLVLSRQTSYLQDIVLKWVYKFSIKMAKWNSEAKEKWPLSNSKSS